MSRFWRSLQFRIPAVFVSAFVLALAAILVVLSTYGKRLLEDYAKREVMLSGQNIVAELGGRIAYAESLAGALANLGEGLAHDAALTQSLVKEVMDSPGTEAFIAGGGLWPEPYQFDPQQERRSFFFGRDAAGALQYLDGYNAPEGAGYHQEEWYVPSRYVPSGGVFWSKSYMDPYSYQPMVTVTAPMHRAGRFYGVTTIDLKLEGLHELLERAARPLAGYAFAVDRNGKLLAFPDERQAKVYGTDRQGKRTEEFIDVVQLARHNCLAMIHSWPRTSLPAAIRSRSMRRSSLPQCLPPCRGRTWLGKPAIRNCSSTTIRYWDSPPSPPCSRCRRPIGRSLP